MVDLLASATLDLQVELLRQAHEKDADRIQYLKKSLMTAENASSMWSEAYERKNDAYRHVRQKYAELESEHQQLQAQSRRVEIERNNLQAQVQCLQEANRAPPSPKHTRRHTKY